MKKRLLLGALMGALLVTACGPKGPGPRPTPEVDDTEFCDPAFENLKAKGCEEAFTPGGTPYNVFCKETHEQGTIMLNPRCVAELTTCEQIDDCTYSNEGDQ